MNNSLHTEINSHGIFKSVDPTLNPDDESNNYNIAIFHDSFGLLFEIGKFEYIHGKYYDSLITTIDDEVGHLVLLELHYNKEDSEINYRWINPKNDSIGYSGGYPMIMNPKIVLGPHATDFIVFTYSSETIILSSLQVKFEFLDFWGTYCIPFLNEIPYIMELRETVTENEPQSDFLIQQLKNG